MGPGRKPRKPVFSERGSFLIDDLLPVSAGLFKVFLTNTTHKRHLIRNVVIQSTIFSFNLYKLKSTLVFGGKDFIAVGHYCLMTCFRFLLDCLSYKYHTCKGIPREHCNTVYSIVLARTDRRRDHRSLDIELESRVEKKNKYCFHFFQKLKV